MEIKHCEQFKYMDNSFKKKKVYFQNGECKGTKQIQHSWYIIKNISKKKKKREAKNGTV